MLLTLETATFENGSFTWQFPQMKFSMCIQAYDVGSPISYDYIYPDTEREICQLIMPPNFYPFNFENDHLTIKFVDNPMNRFILTPSELTIELTEINI